MTLFYTLKILVYMGVATVAAVAGSRRLRKLRRQIEVNGVALAAWAERQGWRAAEGSDPDVAALVDEMQALLAEEGQRGVGGIAIGENGAGPILVAETFRSDVPEPRRGTEAPLPWSGPNGAPEVGPSVDVSFATRHAASPTLLVVTPSGVVRHELGEAPATPAQESALAGLPPGARLRVMPGRLLLRTPRFFTAAIVEDLLARLATLDGKQASAAGPHR